jgi:hypothetical protein
MASIVARSQFVMERFTYQAAATSPGLMVKHLHPLALGSQT